MISMVLRDSTLESLTPSVNVPLGRFHTAMKELVPSVEG